MPTTPTVPLTEAEAIITATRLWLERAVIGLNLCPFAKAVHVKQQIRWIVSPARHLDALLDDLDRELLFLADTDPEAVDTTLLIHPWFANDFLVFNDLMTVADGVVAEHGLEGVLQVAGFHPDFQFEGVAADDIGNATNRSPFPTLHLLRESSVARAVATFPDPESIYQRNIVVLQRLGREGLTRVLSGDAANPTHGE